MKVEVKKCKMCSKVFESEEDYLHGTSRWRKCTSDNLWFDCSCGSTLMLTKDKYPWYSTDKILDGKEIGVFNHLSSKKEWPYIKTSIYELQKLLSDNKEKIDIDKIVTELKKEPIIAGEVLSVSNQLKQLNHDKKNIDDLTHSIVYVGLDRLSEIVMYASVMNIPIKSKNFSMKEFWEESQKTALVTEFLTRKFAPHLNSENMYFAGFLMKIGKIVSAFYYPEEVDLIMREMKNPKNKISWVQLEKHLNIKSYTVLGELACALWGFPNYITESCKYHTIAPKSKIKKFSRNDIVAFSNQMSNWLLYLSFDIDYDILYRLADRLGVSKQGLSDLAYETADYVNRER